MKNFDRRFSVVLICALIVSVILSACSGDSGGSPSESSAPQGDQGSGSSTTPAPAGDGEEDPYANRVSLTYLNRIVDMSNYKGGSDVERELEARFNVELDGIAINALDAEKLSVTLAGGTIPDVFIWRTPQAYYRDGIIRTIPEELVRQYMPNTVAILDAFDPEYGWGISRDYESGELLMIPAISMAGAVKSQLFTRQDWLDNAGIAKLPETVDEVHEMLRRFTFEDPDGNGQNDTYGMASGWFNGAFWAFNTLQGAFGINAASWTERNGTVIHGAVTEDFRQFLKTISAWFAEGLIDPSIGDSYLDVDTKIVNGLIGSHATNIQYFFGTGYKDPFALIKEEHGADYVALPPTVGPAGHSGGFTFSPYFGWGMMFGHHATDEQIIRAMQIADAVQGDIDLYKLVKFGVEGVTYDINENGVATIRQGVDQAEQGVAIFFNHIQIQPEQNALLFGQEVMEIMKENIEQVPYTGHVINHGQLLAMFEKDVSVQYTEMERLVSEFFADAMTGRIDIDSEWDAYVDRWNSMGGAKLTEAAQNLPRLNSNWSFEVFE